MHLNRSLTALLVGLVVLAGAPAATAAQPTATPAEPDVVPGELVVGFEDGVGGRDRARLRSRHGLRRAAELPAAGLELVRTEAHSDPSDVAAELADQPGVRFAEPNYVVRTADTPDDPGFPDLWGLHNTGQTGGTTDADIDAPEAWDLAADTSDVVVAVIDEGVDTSHPDLAANIWRNADEVAGNGVDDDGNGYVDDVRGWDFYNDDASVYDAAQGDVHGTHVAGTIAAVADNGIGVVGVSQAQIMPIKFLGPDGGGTAGAVAAIDYAVANGADVINASWTAAGNSWALRDAIDRAAAAGILFVTAAGNGGSDGVGDDIDVSPVYPASYASPNVIAVAATTPSDALASFSNYGPVSVDLGAPGHGIVSTAPGSRYAIADGSSMAAPFVAGAVAHLVARHPTLSSSQIRDRLFSSVDPRPSLAGGTVTGGRLNLAAALAGTVATEPTLDSESDSDTSTSSGDPVTRIAGEDRLATAVAISQAGFADQTARAVVLARSDDFADALAGAALAVAEGGPLLLTPPDRLAAVVADELRRVLEPGATVHLLGGTAALSPAVAETVQALGHPVTRHAGANRFATAAAIAEATTPAPGGILLTTGRSFPDALAASAAAAEIGGVVVLTNGSRTPAATQSYLDAHPGVPRYAIGGPAAAAAPGATPLVGANRYATAASVASTFFPEAAVVGLATGRSFPDALGAGARLGRLGGPLLLTGTQLPASAVPIVAPAERVEVYGGTAVVSAETVEQLRALVL